jgi:hypothetical protein
VVARADHVDPAQADEPCTEAGAVGALALDLAKLGHPGRDELQASGEVLAVEGVPAEGDDARAVPDEPAPAAGAGDDRQRRPVVTGRRLQREPLTLDGVAHPHHLPGAPRHDVALAVGQQRALRPCDPFPLTDLQRLGVGRGGDAEQRRENGGEAEAGRHDSKNRRQTSEFLLCAHL